MDTVDDTQRFLIEVTAGPSAGVDTSPALTPGGLTLEQGDTTLEVTTDCVEASNPTFLSLTFTVQNIESVIVTLYDTGDALIDVFPVSIL